MPSYNTGARLEDLITKINVQVPERIVTGVQCAGCEVVVAPLPHLLLWPLRNIFVLYEDYSISHIFYL